MNRGLFILGELSDADVDWLSERGRLERVAPGLPLILEGQAIEHVYLVLSGRFAVAQRAELSDVGVIGPGEMMGEMSFLESRPPAADVRAGEAPCEVLSIPRAALLERLESEPELAARFYRGLARVLSARLRDALAGLSRRDPDHGPPADPHELATLERGAALLERISGRLGAGS